MTDHPLLDRHLAAAAAPVAGLTVDRQSAPTPVCDLKFGQFGVACVTLARWDIAALCAELGARVAAAPPLFARAPLLFDLNQLPSLPSVEALRALIAGVRATQLLPVGLADGAAAVATLAQALDLPLFPRSRTAPRANRGKSLTEAANATVPVATTHGQLHQAPVRSGQQVYAAGRDLILTAMVGNGAEVIADGSIHIYGVLRGRALAGAKGDASARIFCQDFRPELIAIAGQYRVFEAVDPALHGKPVQAWLEGETLQLAPL